MSDAAPNATDRPSLPLDGGATSSLPFVPFEQATILGVGLMGGSLGMALRERRLARAVVGWDRSSEALETAVLRGATDSGTQNLADAVRNADAVFLAVPVGAMRELLERLARHVRPDALITDLGSVKTEVVSVGDRLFGSRFIGGHPMAGSEQGGTGAARSDLFTGAAWAVVPHASSDSPDLLRLMALIEALDARAMLLDAPSHDRLVALVSHLPHALAFALQRTVEADPERPDALQLSGGSYRDMTRVASSDPALWSGILLANRPSVLSALAAFELRLSALTQAIRTGDAVALEQLLSPDNPPHA